MRRIFLTGVCALLLIAVAAGQAAAQPATDTAALAHEVRLLRQAIEALSSTSLRTHLLLGRLQLQEERTDKAAQRLEQIREELRFSTERVADMSTSIKRQEEMDPSTLDPKQHAMHMNELHHLKAYLASQERSLAQLAAKEADAASALALEQSIWSDLNRALEDLERGLVRAQR